MNKYILQFRTVLVLCIALICFISSCRKIDAGAFNAATPGISFTQEQMDVSNLEDTIEITINSNLPWRVKVKDAWLTALESNGQGNGKFRVAIAKNRITESRTAEIFAYITEDAHTTMKIVQAAGDPPPDHTRHFFVKTDGDAANDGLLWANATTLDNALANAANGDFIHIAEGTYRPQVSITGGNAANAADNTFEIAQNIHLVGGYPADATTGSVADAVSHPVILSGNDQHYHVVVITALPETGHFVSLSGLTITGGHAGSSGFVSINGVNLNRNYGGGMIISNAKVLMDNCNISGNKSDGHIPGLFLTGQAELTIQNSIITSNEGTAAGTNGGGIWNDGSTLYMYDSEISNNRVGGVGGGLYSLHTARISYNYLYNVTISGNAVGTMGATTRVGAGIYSREKSQYLILNSTIYGNNNNGTGFGAGITAYGGSTVNIVSSTISNNEGGAGNTATTGGSGVFNNNSPTANTVNIYNSIVSGNRGYTSEIGGANISLQSSINGSAVYDYTKALVAGQSFDPLTMFGNFALHGGMGQTLPLTAAATPALTYGMTQLQLQVLAANLLLNNEYYLKDQHHRPRSSQPFMGAAGPL